MFLAVSWLHLIRGRVRSLKCVARAPSCQTFWRVRLIAHRLPALFVWYISNKPREAYHFSYFLSPSLPYSPNKTYFLKKEIQHVLLRQQAPRPWLAQISLEGQENPLQRRREETFIDTSSYITTPQMVSLSIVNMHYCSV